MGFKEKFSKDNVAIFVSMATLALTILLQFTPLSKYTYRRAEISVVDKGNDVEVDYDPAARLLILGLKITLINSGGRDGLLVPEDAELSDVDEEAALVPFHSSDIHCGRTDRSSDVITVPKGDSQETITCSLQYQVSDLGLPVLRRASTKILNVRLRGADKPLVLKYNLQGWDPTILDSKALAKRSYYEK